MPFPSPTLFPTPTQVTGGVLFIGAPQIDLSTPLVLDTHVTTLSLNGNETGMGLVSNETEMAIDGD